MINIWKVRKKLNHLYLNSFIYKCAVSRTFSISVLALQWLQRSYDLLTFCSTSIPISRDPLEELKLMKRHLRTLISLNEQLESSHVNNARQILKMNQWLMELEFIQLSSEVKVRQGKVVGPPTFFKEIP